MKPHHNQILGFLILVAVTLTIILLANWFTRKIKNPCKICGMEDSSTDAKEHKEICCNCAHGEGNVTTGEK